MNIDNYTTIPKIEVTEFIKNAKTKGYIISSPIEHYTIEEIKSLSELAKKNDLILTIKQETSNLYYGVMINLLRKDVLKENNVFVDYI